MKHAALIIAHKNADQLIRLIQALDDPDIDVYVHIDKKWDIDETDIRRIQEATAHVTVIPKRISGFLNEWNLCEITVELMKAACAAGADYHYFCLMSGQDYPIKSMGYIKKYLQEKYPTPLIDCTPMRKDNKIYSGFRWIRFHRYYRFAYGITSNRKLRKCLLLPAYAVQFVVTGIVGSPYKKMKKLNCDIYGGSAWWILPREIIEFCIEEVDRRSEIVKVFQIKNTPEETFFQTMAMRSALKDQIEINDPYERLQNCMTYAYFFDETHPPACHPYILKEENYEMLRNRRELFARKFDMNEDAKILDLLDRDRMRAEE